MLSILTALTCIASSVRHQKYVKYLPGNMMEFRLACLLLACSLIYLQVPPQQQVMNLIRIFKSEGKPGKEPNSAWRNMKLNEAKCYHPQHDKER
ncbi:UNVERIFIED_CONTAM: hypothetical protein K2H54_056650 [Gekko kuhli]